MPVAIRAVGIVAGALLVLAILREAFETVVLPRRPSGRWRLTRLYLSLTWRGWRWLALRFRAGPLREAFLSWYGPLTMLSLIASWAIVIIVGFGLIEWGIHAEILTRSGSSGAFATYLYASGTTLFTLGLGDIVPHSSVARLLTVLEAGLGLAFLALVVSYVPVLYGAFSRRELLISMLDARAGSPPSAGEFLRQLPPEPATEIERTLAEFERWAGELLESHLSYPLLMTYRSQHDHQSWIGAITAMLDISSVIVAAGDDRLTRCAELTFAMARHAVVDLAQVFPLPQKTRGSRPVPAPAAEQIHALLVERGLTKATLFEFGVELERRVRQYGPYADLIAGYLMMPVGDWLPVTEAEYDWTIAAAER